jgi:heme/copper-type cytochrome/quinol oxidase subunit 3
MKLREKLEGILNSIMRKEKVGGWRAGEWGYPYENQEVIFLANVYQPKHEKRHPYHIVRASVAPLMTTLPLGYFVLNYFGVISSKLGLIVAISSFIGGLIVWGVSVVYDSLYDQQHTYEVKRGLVMGMLLFIISEVMFFFSFFWSYFYISLSPTIAIGCVWPPYGLTVYSYMGLPLLNTVLLLLSGAILTDGYTILTEQKAVHETNEKVMQVEQYFRGLEALYNHKKSINTLGFVEERREKFVKKEEGKEENKEKKEIAISAGVKELRDIEWDLYFFENPENVEPNYKEPKDLNIIEFAYVTVFLKARNELIKTRLYLTLICAAVFLCCQGYEYYSAPFSMNDGIYGSLFFLLTGFHGFHVLVGSILIAIITVRFLAGNFNLLNIGTKFQIFKNKSTGFACTLFYWHFVDIVWIFLYIVIYWWGSQ